LSGLIVALKNLEMNLPCFVTKGDHKKNEYIGNWQSENETVTFKSEMFKEVPSLYVNFKNRLNDIGGVVDLFTLAINSPLNRSLRVSSRYTYFVDTTNDFQVAEKFELIKFGTFDNPIDCLQISPKWTALSENNLSSFKSYDAPFFSLRCLEDKGIFIFITLRVNYFIKKTQM
jgi:hypothetical protein